MLSSSPDQRILSYETLRRVVGFIGIGLPVTLLFGHPLLGRNEIKGSISSYFYSELGPVFVGSLCVMGVFLLAYDHPRGEAWWSTTVAGVCALGVALFPTKPEEPTRVESWVGGAHFAFAVLLFVTLAYIAAFKFTRGLDRRSRQYSVYVGCAIVMLVCLVLAGVMFWLPEDSAPRTSWELLFWLESLMVVSFGISWLVKGAAGKIVARVLRRSAA